MKINLSKMPRAEAVAIVRDYIEEYKWGLRHEFTQAYLKGNVVRAEVERGTYFIDEVSIDHALLIRFGVLVINKKRFVHEEDLRQQEEKHYFNDPLDVHK